MSILLTMIPIAFVYASPIIIAALGGFFSERSGVVNIALEGIMMVGGFAAASVTVLLEPLTPMAGYIGLLAGVAAGIAFSLIHAFASVNLKADQVISGTALNILAGGLTVYLCQIFFNQQRTKAFRTGLAKLSVPGLADIPIIGPLFFKDVSPPFYVARRLGLAVLVRRLQDALRPAPALLRRASPGRRLDGHQRGQDALRRASPYRAPSRAWPGGAMVLTQDIQYTDRLGPRDGLHRPRLPYIRQVEPLRRTRRRPLLRLRPGLVDLREGHPVPQARCPSRSSTCCPTCSPRSPSWCSRASPSGPRPRARSTTRGRDRDRARAYTFSRAPSSKPTETVSRPS